MNELKWNIQNRSGSGVNIDIDGMKVSDRDVFTDWLLKVVESFHKSNLFVSVTVPMNNDAFDYKNIGALADMVLIKGYDENIFVGKPGPIASIYWFENSLDALLQKIPPSKVLTIIGSH